MNQIGKEYLQQIDNEIQNLYKELQINLTGSDISQYLNMSEDNIKLLSAERCVELSVLISSFSLYVKKEENKYNAYCTRIKDYLDFIVTREAKNYCDPKYTKFEEKVNLVCIHDDYAKELKKTYNQILTKKLSIEHLSISLNNIANNLVELRKTKYGK